MQLLDGVYFLVFHAAQLEPLIYLQYSSNKGKFYFRKNPANPPYAPALTVNGTTVVGNNNNQTNVLYKPSKSGTVTDWGFDVDFRIKSEPNRDIEMNFGWLCGFQKPIYYYESDYVGSLPWFTTA